MNSKERRRKSASSGQRSPVTGHAVEASSHPSRVTSHGFFVTGTDTAVGKTLVACALLNALAERGVRAVGMKPVAAGAIERNGALINEDVVALNAASGIAAPAALVNPYCFAPPIAPHIAAAQAGVAIEIARIEQAFHALRALADCVIVEGAGGFRVPLNAREDFSHLARTLALPVVLVVGMKLGCINHALLTQSALQAAGLTLAGWIANHIDPDMACADENVAALAERIGAPMLARIPHARQPEPARIARTLHLDALHALHSKR